MDPGRIDQIQGQISDMYGPFNDIPGRPRDISHDRFVFLQQGIQQ